MAENHSPIKRWWAAALAALGLVAGPGATPAPSPLASARSWAVFYGEEAPKPLLNAPDVLVLEPDHAWTPSTLRRPGQRILAYLSLGEVHASRPYYKALSKAPGALAGPNPDWPDAWRVDPRSTAWREQLLGHIAPAILAKGYDGFFFDTLDVGGWLESQGKHPGARAAMAGLIVEIHTRFPQAALMANGGLDLLPEAAPALAALATESVFTGYQFDKKRYAWREATDTASRLARLSELQAQHGLPVFVIEYVDPMDAPMRRSAAEKVLKAGFVPYVADIGLSRLDPPPSTEP